MRALYVGPPLGVGFHRGAVACFALALDGRLEVSSDSPAARSGSVGSALVGAGLRHEIRVAGARAAFLYLDATDALAAQLRARMRAIHPHLHVAHPGAPAFRRALERGAGLGASRRCRLDESILASSGSSRRSGAARCSTGMWARWRARLACLPRASCTSFAPRSACPSVATGCGLAWARR